jgi:hypothetical protein
VKFVKNHAAMLLDGQVPRLCLGKDAGHVVPAGQPQYLDARVCGPTMHVLRLESRYGGTASHGHMSTSKAKLIVLKGHL